MNLDECLRFNDDVIESLSQVPTDEEKPDLELEEKMRSTRGATTEIITEPKKKPSGAPKSSLRPKGRPQIQPDSEIKDTDSVDLANAVSSALSGIEKSGRARWAVTHSSGALF